MFSLGRVVHGIGQGGDDLWCVQLVDGHGPERRQDGQHGAVMFGQGAGDVSHVLFATMIG